MPIFKENTNFKMPGWSAFTKKNTHADEVLVEGQKDATETIFGEGDKAKIDAITSVADLTGSGAQEILKKRQG